MYQRIVTSVDGGKSDGLGSGAKWKNSPFENLKNFCSVFQNDLAFLGRMGKVSLSEFPEIYATSLSVCVRRHPRGGFLVSAPIRRRHLLVSLKALRKNTPLIDKS